MVVQWPSPLQAERHPMMIALIRQQGQLRTEYRPLRVGKTNGAERSGHGTAFSVKARPDNQT